MSDRVLLDVIFTEMLEVPADKTRDTASLIDRFV